MLALGGVLLFAAASAHASAIYLDPPESGVDCSPACLVLARMDNLELGDSNAPDGEQSAADVPETDLSEIIGSFLGSLEAQVVEKAPEREDASPRQPVANGAMLYSASVAVAGLLLLVSIASGVAILRLRPRES